MGTEATSAATATSIESIASSSSLEVRSAPTLVACAGVACALYVVAAWALELPGAWKLERVVDPARRAREVALHASARVASFAAENARTPPGSIAFVGSSTIERMPLATLFPGKPCANRGVASADANELRAWIPRALPPAPSAFVVYAGSSDLREEALDAVTIVARVAELVAELRRVAPAAPVLVLGLLPERDMSAESRSALAAIDAELARLAAADPGSVTFLPTARPPLSRPDGSLSEQHSSDRYHLDDAGYAVLASWIRAEGGAVGRLLTP